MSKLHFHMATRLVITVQYITWLRGVDGAEAHSAAIHQPCRVIVPRPNRGNQIRVMLVLVSIGAWLGEKIVDLMLLDLFQLLLRVECLASIFCSSILYHLTGAWAKAYC
jgi:hypothetical protein